MSRIGRMPITVPAGVEVTIAENNVVTVKGPKGTLTQALRPEMILEQDGSTIHVKRPSDDKLHCALHGMTRALLHNMVVGVSEGFKKELEINGVGYRAAKEGNELVMNLGYSHPVKMAEIDGITIEVPQDSRTRTSLPDGTVVWLNAGSRLAYSQGFGVKDRNVRLEGEGFFEVEKNEQLPFCVHTSSVCVQDLGTAFNFRDYPDDKEAEVILAEGCIRLENLVRKGSPELMKPGDRIVVDKHTGTLVRDTYDANLANQWTGGRLIFDGESIETIARKIEQCYHVSVTLASEGLEDCHFYGTFIRMENSLTEVLDALAATGKVRYRIEGRHVTLYSN